MHILVKLIVISIVLSSFNNTDLFCSMSGQLIVVCLVKGMGHHGGSGTTVAAMVGRCT